MQDYWRTAQKAVHLPFIDTIEDTLDSFSASGRVLFFICAFVCIASSVALLYRLNASLLVAVPEYGGSITEGIIGSPRFINPVLAISDSDRDLTALTYSGLLHATSQGDYIPDLAQSYSVSPDGMTYTVVLRDGTPVTVEDVLFTINKTQDSALKSPVRANWAGVDVEKVDDHTLTFTLKSPYAPFIENLTLGILPKHLWSDITDDEFAFSTLNAQPVGSGPFTVTSIAHSSNGVPTSYNLQANRNYALGRPYLDEVNIKFYQSEEALTAALKSGTVESASDLSPQNLSQAGSNKVFHSPLNRVYGVFFNQNQSEVLRDIAVRKALSLSVDKPGLVQQVLNGFGTPLDGPLPSDALAATFDATSSRQQAQQLLQTAGWAPGPGGTLVKTTGKTSTTLTISLATADVPELRAAAQYLATSWGRIGVHVDVQVYSQGDLTENVIRPRKYDALLFGEVISREPDLYAFWGSSERLDPGLNIAQYANTTADTILQKLRQTNDTAVRQDLYNQLDVQLQKDVPAVFLYSPDFVYSMPNDTLGLTLGVIETPSDRFLSITEWHREVDHVWPFFVPTTLRL
jgi:peptide/nickel transport system substrate-binding protein